MTKTMWPSALTGSERSAAAIDERNAIWLHYHYLDLVMYGLYLADTQTLDAAIETLRVRVFE
jgi:hypothetical protein